MHTTLIHPPGVSASPNAPVMVEGRFNGPPGRGHGGVTAGRCAAAAGERSAVVRLHAPIPLDTPLVPFHRPDDVTEFWAADQRVTSVTPMPLPLDVADFAPVADDLVQWAELAWLDDRGGRHPFPTCFACGSARPDGLGLRPGLVAGQGVYVTRWVPRSADDELVWAALDCGSAGPAVRASDPSTAPITGEIAVDVRAAVVPGVPYLVQSRVRREDGRKQVVEAAVTDLAGAPAAVGVVTWFVGRSDDVR